MKRCRRQKEHLGLSIRIRILHLSVKTLGPVCIVSYLGSQISNVMSTQTNKFKEKLEKR
jgi:hypothetical protein